jgi:hypothetical protein
MPIPAGLAFAGKLLGYGSTGLLVDDLTGKNLQRLFMGTPEGQRNYTVDAEGNYQPRKVTEATTQEAPNFLQRFLFGTPQEERNYTIDENYEYQSVDPAIGRTVSSADTKPTVVNKSTQLPASAEQTFIDPYAYQLQVYGQGRKAAQSQEEMDKVRDLGLAIHRNMYPQFYNNTSMSPQMRETFPDRATQSLENTVQEKGIQLPASMIDADSKNELLASQEEASIYQLDQATADVEDLLKLIAERRQQI